MLRNILFASMIAFGAAGAAVAAEGPRLVGGGTNAEVEYSGAPEGVVVGGGTVLLNGGGENRSFTYGQVNALPGRIGQVVGGGENTEVVYQPTLPATGLARAPGNAFRG
jgi:hypothetical protein